MRIAARNLLARVLAVALAAGALTLSAIPASAAPGDVAAATLQWGVKQSFREYITGPIAHGAWTVSGGVTDTVPFSWSGGEGSASTAAGSVSYPGSIRFTGHGGALDLSISGIRVVQSSAAAAQLVVDVRSNSMADPATFTDYPGIAFADLALDAGVASSTSASTVYAAVPATLTAAGATAFSGFYPAGSALDPVSFSWPIEQAPVPATPTITVSKSADISPAGEIITVTGTGFGPVAPGTNATRPPLAGQFGGAYVAFGKYPDAWKPSAGVSSTLRKNAATAWVVNPADLATIGGTAAGGVPINPDGSFSVQLLVSKGFSGEPAIGNYGIYTYGGGSSNYAPFETYTLISFSTAPTVKVSKTEGLNPLGDTLTVTGWNFGPNAPATNASRPPLAGQFGGAYVAFGKYPDAWKPSAGVSSALRKNASTAWVVNPANLATIGGAAAGGVAVSADGSFSVTLAASRGFVGEPELGNYGIYTYGGGSSNYAPFETYTPVSFTAATNTTTTLSAAPATGLVEGGSTTIAATVAPAAAGTVSFTASGSPLGTVAVDAAGAATLPLTGIAAGDTEVTAVFTPANPLVFAASSTSITVNAAAKVIGAGSLTWGIKQSFREYVAGPIAKGSISTVGAGTVGGAFRFGQSSGGSYSASTGVGTSAYSGGVRFYGHGGLLDVTLASPMVTISSATTATLSMTVNGGKPVAFATLALGEATKTTPNDTVSYAEVPAVLTAQGARVLSYNGSAFYAAGTPLDPVSFVVGAESAVAGSATVAAFRAPAEPAATPPATTGVTSTSGTALVEGQESSFTATGYRAGETGILAVIYSQPTVLARDLVADRTGTVTWTGVLPVGLSGEHTFTFQGSIDTGVIVTITPLMTPAAAYEGCPVTEATLEWGFKESFRSYISGSIANGEWAVADGAAYDTPSFLWSNGEGSYDSAAGRVSFTGSITFTGHGGVLNTTVANPELRIDDEGVAYLVMDVSGITQEGIAVDAPDVDFVRVDLAEATAETVDGVLTFSAAPTELTQSGAEAFGTYPAGEDFDPLTLSFAAAECGAVAAPQPAASADPLPLSTTPVWLPWLVVAALLLIAVVVVVVIARRRA